MAGAWNRWLRGLSCNPWATITGRPEKTTTVSPGVEGAERSTGDQQSREFYRREEVFSFFICILFSIFLYSVPYQPADVSGRPFFLYAQVHTVLIDIPEVLPCARALINPLFLPRPPRTAGRGFQFIFFFHLLFFHLLLLYNIPPPSPPRLPT